MPRVVRVSRTGRIDPRAVGRWVLRRPPVEWGTALVVLVLLASGLFGGLREVDTDPVRPLVVGEPVAADPVELTVEAVYTVTQFPGIPASGDTPEAYPDDPSGGRFVVVEGTVTNTSDATLRSDVLYRLIGLDGVEGDEGTGGFVSRTRPGELVTAADARPALAYTMPEKRALTAAQPGLTYRVAWLFDQSSSRPAPTRLTVAVNEHTWRQDTLDFSYGWKDPEPRARAVVPVGAGRPS